jgi:FlaA1/EpsC-like NDP-sugar epimerase
MSTLAAIATGRDRSIFAADVAAHTDQINAAFGGKRVLIIGGAGSIGAATLRAILPFDPASVHVIDHNENGLAELVRDLRSTGLAGKSLDLKLMPLDYGSSVSRRFLATSGKYDAVLHFAALKHVRSEKDVSSILQMIDTNVLKQQLLMDWLAELGPPTRYFAVSTDKAANPANFMGASKRLMEHLLFTKTASPLANASITSARFANVAFSTGSLLAGFSARIERRQPIAVPREARRYFVSVEEAAEICLLAAAAYPESHLAIPRMHADKDLRALVPIAEAFIESAGFKPRLYEDEATARSSVETDSQAGAWPLLLTPLNTEGEKEREVFIGANEQPTEVGLSALLAIAQKGADAAALTDALEELRTLATRHDTKANRRDLAAIIQSVVTEFRPIESNQSLDQRM